MIPRRMRPALQTTAALGFIALMQTAVSTAAPGLASSAFAAGDSLGLDAGGVAGASDGDQTQDAKTADTGGDAFAQALAALMNAAVVPVPVSTPQTMSAGPAQGGGAGQAAVSTATTAPSIEVSAGTQRAGAMPPAAENATSFIPQTGPQTGRPSDALLNALTPAASTAKSQIATAGAGDGAGTAKNPTAAPSPGAPAPAVATMQTAAVPSPTTPPTADAAATAAAVTAAADGTAVRIAAQVQSAAAPPAGSTGPTPTAPSSSLNAKSSSRTSTISDATSAPAAATSSVDAKPLAVQAASTPDDKSSAGKNDVSGDLAPKRPLPTPAPSGGELSSTVAVATPAAAAAAVATAPTNATVPVASQIATQVIKAVEGKSTRFDIALDPAGLGRVDVRIQIDSSGQVSAALTFDNAHTAAEARGHAVELQQALEQAGFSVGQGGLSFDVGGQGAGLARQDAQPQTQQASTPTRASVDQPTPATPANLSANQTLRASGVDITI